MRRFFVGKVTTNIAVARIKAPAMAYYSKAQGTDRRLRLMVLLSIERKEHKLYKSAMRKRLREVRMPDKNALFAGHAHDSALPSGYFAGACIHGIIHCEQT